MIKNNIAELKRTLTIPVSIFESRDLGVLESLVLHMRENLKLRNSEIARILNRDDRTVWTAYSRAKTKRGMNDDKR